MERKWSILSSIAAILITGTDMKAQFNTIIDRRNINYEIIPQKQVKDESIENKRDTLLVNCETKDTIRYPLHEEKQANHKSKEPVRKKHLDRNHSYEGLPGLTINNLVQEIRKNGIVHEKVVLAQAILETGWFTSSVCRNKNNLFGLTNPRTGEYYEFNHWSESVKAYYTKVQYRYKGGNYLLWLDKIGYAEDKTYVLAIIKLLRQYFI